LGVRQRHGQCTYYHTGARRGGRTRPSRRRIPYFCACQGSCALRLARATVSLLVNANRKHRHVIDARRPIQYGGGACNLLLRTGNGHLELLFHATPQTGAVLTRAQAVEHYADYLEDWLDD
jgi:hypothetical protein